VIVLAHGQVERVEAGGVEAGAGLAATGA